jgi:glycosyltransferase involved in cell wall biosynthesis
MIYGALNLRSKIRESTFAGQAYLWFQRLSQASSSRRAIFFPDQLYTGTAGDLRAVAIARELRRLGWRTIVVPPWLDLRARHAIIGIEPNAVLFLQQSRHPLNKPALYPNNCCVFDADDADILNNPEQVVECLTGSAAVIAGSEFLAEKFRPHNPNVQVIWTGTYIDRSKEGRTVSDNPTLVWAQGNPFDYPHEAALMLALWTKLAETSQFNVAVYSSEPARVGEWLAPLTRLGVSHRARPRMRYPEFVASLSGAAIGLQPICTSFAYSQGKSFGKVLAYIAAGVPVVASDEVDHARFFRNGENGLLVRTLDDWVDACKLLLNEPRLGKQLAERAHEDLGRELSTRAAAEKVDKVLDAVRLKCVSTLLHTPG